MKILGHLGHGNQIKKDEANSCILLLTKYLLESFLFLYCTATGFPFSFLTSCFLTIKIFLACFDKKSRSKSL